MMGNGLNFSKWKSQKKALLGLWKFSCNKMGSQKKQQRFKCKSCGILFRLNDPALRLNYILNILHLLDVAFKKSVLNKKLDLKMNVVVVFKTFRYLWTTDIGGQVSDFDQYFLVRTIGVSLRYNFSSMLGL